MPGEIVALQVGEVVRRRYVESKTSRWGQELKCFVDTSKLSKDNTYLLIFSVAQAEDLRRFKEELGEKILFESKPSVNWRPYHDHSENTLVIFEI